MSYIQYSGKFDEIFTENVLIDYCQNGITSIELIFKDKTLQIKFNLKDNPTVREAMQLVEVPLENIINLLLYHYGYLIRDVDLDRFNNIVYESANLSGTLKMTITPDFEEIMSGIKNEQLLSDIRGNMRFRLYKSAINIKDPIGKFMFLYSILYDIKGNQSNIEKYIKHKVPNIEICTRVDTRTEKPIKETVFSWIRNQVGHTHDTTNINQVTEKIKQNTDTFERLVKTVIFNG